MGDYDNVTIFNCIIENYISIIVNFLFDINMKKIALSIILVLLVVINSGCITSAAEKEPIPDPIVSTWHRESYSGIPIIVDFQVIDWAPEKLVINDDNTCTIGTWKWISNNSYEVDSSNPFIPNATIKLEDGKLKLHRASIVHMGIVDAIYTK